MAEEVPIHAVAKAPTEDAEGTRLIAELTGRLGGGEVVREEGPEGFVLALARVRRVSEEALFGCYRNLNPISLQGCYHP
jgi:hypothetical protein